MYEIKWRDKLSGEKRVIHFTTTAGTFNHIAVLLRDRVKVRVKYVERERDAK